MITVSISRLLRMRSDELRDTGPAIELTSCLSISLIVPPALICGLTSRLMPTFWRCTVRNWLSKFCESASPVVTGISWPTRIRAS